MTSAIASAISRQLPDVLPRQRWFGNKARRIERCDVDDVAQLAERCYLLLAGVWFADGTKERYVLLLRQTTDSTGLPLLVSIDAPDPGFLVEAASDQHSAVHLLGGFRGEANVTTQQGGTLRYGDCGPGAAREILNAWPAIRPLGAEQSNTSLRVGASLIFKLFRRLEEGENPELEISRFLTTRTSFRDISVLEGSLTYESPEGRVSTVGVLQQWVDNDGDGWAYTLSALRDFRSSSPAKAGHYESGPVKAGHYGSGRLTADLTHLGSITAHFHAALASDPSVESFRPEATEPVQVAAWKRHLHERAERVRRLLAARIDSLPPHARSIAAVVVEGHARLFSFIAVDRRSDFVRIRIHGDYHLGQTLKTRDGFVVIDFEGEPATPLAERRLKLCALKDVAGMLRSFDYAIDVACGAELDPTDRRALSATLRAAFLNGYLLDPVARGAPWLPPDTAGLQTWVQFFELEKALYEVEYELNNRPEWVHIPLRAIARALDAGSTQL